MARLYANNYTSTLSAAITNSATSAVVTSSTGLPTITGADYYYLTLAAGGVIEIVKVTARSGTTLTIVRAQESTTGVAWEAGSIISLRETAESFTSMMSGAGSSTDNAVARFDGTGGATLQNSVVTITDAGIIAGATGLTSTGVIDLGGADSFEIPNSAAPTVNATGEIALDTTITDHKGLIKYYTGSDEMVVIACPTANLTTTDNYVLSYDAATDAFDFSAMSGGGGSGYTHTDLTFGPQTLAVNTEYTSNAGSGLLTATLPATAAVGDIVTLTGNNSGTWKLVANAGQTIKVVSSTTSSGGALQATGQWDCVSVKCVVANTTWVVFAGTTSGYTIT